MRTNAIVRIVLYSLLILVLLGILLAGLGIGNLTFFIGSDSGTVVDTEASVKAQGIRNLQIDWAAGSIRIETAQTDTITFRETVSEDTQYQMTYHRNGDTLELSYGSGVSISLISIPSKDLVITVPDDWTCGTLEIDGASLSIDIAALTVEAIDLDGAANELKFRGNLQELDIDGASNSITAVCFNTPTRIELDGMSIEMDLTLPENTGFTTEVNGLSCDFRSEFTTTASGNTHTYGDGSCQIGVNGLSCNINIRKGTQHTQHDWDAGTVHTVPGDGKQEMVFTCTVCGKTRSEPITDAKVYAVNYADEDTKTYILEPLMANYAAGATVTIKTSIIYDADLQLFIDGVYHSSQTAVQTGDNYTHWEFSFVMPDHDITIALKTHGGM